jgi:crotonobetainyl-CoA:carnitine CoA-transferase CaiB-like acyl-CoA transferase
MSLLQGIKVIELSSDAAVSACGRVLADWKADVIKVEPTGGDIVDDLSARLRTPCNADENPIREIWNANKKSISANLETKAGLAVIERLIGDADVFLTGFPTTKPNWRFPDYEDLSKKFPQLIYASLSAYGSKGKLGTETASGAESFWARGGFCGFFGEPDAPPVLPLPGMDAQISGTYLASGIVAALIGRNRTGRGEKVETSMYHCAIWSAGLFNATSNYWENPRKTRRKPDAPLINAFRARDGKWFCTAIMEHERHWPVLCDCIERPDLVNDDRYAVFDNAVQASEELTNLLDIAFERHERAYWLRIFEEKDIPAGAIFEASDVLADQEAFDNDYLKSVTFSNGRTIALASPPTQFPETCTAEWRPAPKKGADTKEILECAGFEAAEIIHLIQSGCVGAAGE